MQCVYCVVEWEKTQTYLKSEAQLPRFLISSLSSFSSHAVEMHHNYEGHIELPSGLIQALNK